MTKEELYTKLKKQNIFWSYNTSVMPKDEIIIEQTLVYAGVEDIQSLFSVFKPSQIKRVWVRKIIPDLRYYKLNYYLGKIFFNIKNIEAYIEKKKSENSRYERLKKLTTY